MSDAKSVHSRTSRVESPQNGIARDVEAIRTDLAAMRSEIKDLNVRVHGLTQELRAFWLDASSPFVDVHERFERLSRSVDAILVRTDRRKSRPAAARAPGDERRVNGRATSPQREVVPAGTP